ncbi:MAG: PIG-L family deacetylase [Chloroflexota bacterium]|nr:PIG-L family deacetylase [Chloroflexota bacterium]
MMDESETMNLPVVERVLVVMAHPDDPEYGAGGTVARLVAQGATVTFAIVTDGSKGSEEEGFTREALFNTRQQEQIAAAAVLGVHGVHFLGFPDGEIYNNQALREAIVRQIRTHRPDLLITHDPTTRIWRDNRINHPDHRAVGDATLDAVYPLARDRLNFLHHEEEGLKPHRVLDILLTGSNDPNFAVDISDVMDTKVRALLAHKSQIREPEELHKRLAEYARELGEQWGLSAAEVFRRVTLER